jgi:hypothetical protein
MTRKAVILLVATVATLAAGVGVAWPRIDFWMLTGSFAPTREVETLQHPVEVTRWDAAGLHLADGRTVELPGVGALPEDSPAVREAMKRGVEVRQDGRVTALVRIHHWCGNDPVREHVARVDLSAMIIFLRLGQPATPVPETERRAKAPGGSFSKSGWNVGEFLQFQSWQWMHRATEKSSS